jgi:hypothetical protein
VANCAECATYFSQDRVLLDMYDRAQVVEFRPSAGTGLEAPNVFVEDYLRRDVGQGYLETDDPAEVTQFLNRELGVRLDPIRLARLRLPRAHIFLLEGRKPQPDLTDEGESKYAA